MRLTSRFLYTVILLLPTLQTCDDFSLSDRFQYTGGLTLSLQRTEVDRMESTTLYPKGGVPPYSYAVMENDLFWVGGIGSFASNSSNTFYAGNSIGGVTIRLMDSRSHSVDASIVIMPPVVATFSVAAVVGLNAIDLSWSYANISMISGFRIERSIEGAGFLFLDTQGSGVTTYRDSGLNKNMTYWYRIFAVSGSYLSRSSPEASAQPNL
jgi:hypothetical protein